MPNESPFDSKPRIARTPSGRRSKTKRYTASKANRRNSAEEVLTPRAVKESPRIGRKMGINKTNTKGDTPKKSSSPDPFTTFGIDSGISVHGVKVIKETRKLEAGNSNDSGMSTDSKSSDSDEQNVSGNLFDSLDNENQDSKRYELSKLEVRGEGATSPEFLRKSASGLSKSAIERAERKREEMIKRGLEIQELERQKAEEEARRQEKLRQEEEERKMAELKKKEDEMKKLEELIRQEEKKMIEQKKMAAEKQRLEEEERNQEEKRRVEEQRKKEERRRKIEDDKAREEERWRKTEEEKQKVEERKRKAEEERKREQERQIEEERKKEELRRERERKQEEIRRRDERMKELEDLIRIEEERHKELKEKENEEKRKAELRKLEAAKKAELLKQMEARSLAEKKGEDEEKARQKKKREDFEQKSLDIVGKSVDKTELPSEHDVNPQLRRFESFEVNFGDCNGKFSGRQGEKINRRKSSLDNSGMYNNEKFRK